MKVNEVLTEDKLASPARMLTLLQQNCKPFLTQAGWDHPMYRGVDRALPEVSIHTNMGHRRPVNTSPAISKVADDWFLEKTGIKFRSNAVFVTGDFATARSYGDVFVMFPIGEFKFCWSPIVEDMFMMFSGMDSRNAQIDDLLLHRLTSALDDANYQTTNLIEAIDSTSEIMVHCDKYYLLSEDMYKTVHSLALKTK